MFCLQSLKRAAGRAGSKIGPRCGPRYGAVSFCGNKNGLQKGAVGGLRQRVGARSLNALACGKPRKLSGAGPTVSLDSCRRSAESCNCQGGPRYGAVSFCGNKNGLQKGAVGGLRQRVGARSLNALACGKPRKLSGAGPTVSLDSCRRSAESCNCQGRCDLQAFARHKIQGRLWGVRRSAV